MVEPIAQDAALDVTRPAHGGRWTVGLDGSECSRHAALWAATVAPGRAGELHLASTWSVPVSTSMTPLGSMTTSASFDALERSATSTVADMAERLGPSLDIPITQTVGQGGAAALLLEAAHHSDLLVVGSRGRGGFARLILGSTSTQCATHSSSPVAVIPATSPIGPVNSIVVAFDGSPNSITALSWAITFATPGTTIDCVSVWDTTPVIVGADQFLFPEGSGLASDRLEYLYAQSIAAVGRDDVEVSHLFVEGSTRMALAEHAENADLLVMGARGHGAIGAVLLGSVSTWLLHHVKRPMVVVPHGPDTDPDNIGTSTLDRDHDADEARD